MLDKANVNRWLQKIAQNDDQRALRHLFDYYYPKLVNYSLYMLESKLAADEVISDVFIGIWNNRARLEEIENFNAYLFRSVKNKCLSYLRDLHRLHAKEFAIEDSNLIKTVDSPESTFINHELRKEILNTLDELPPRCRLVFELVKQDGLKYKEVAELLEISVKTVENQMGKAMSTLRKKLKHLQLTTKTRNLRTGNE